MVVGMVVGMVVWWLVWRYKWRLEKDLDSKPFCEYSVFCAVFCNNYN